jgi:hypothetical protein
MKILLLILLVSALTLSAADVTGKWSGTFEFTDRGDGAKNSTAYLVLKQDGGKLTGTGGPSSDHQEAVIGGKADGNQLIFVAEHNGRAMNFKLQVDGDSMKGEVSRENQEGVTETAIVLLKRVKE